MSRIVSQSCLVVAILLSSGADLLPTRVEESAIEQRLRESVTYLSSDELEGRGVGTEGLEKAARYIAARFEGLGLKTQLFEGSPFQSFEVTMKAELGERRQNRLSFLGPAAEGEEAGQRIELELGQSFNTLAIGGSEKVEAPLVFVGYGITNTDSGYDDYKEVDVKGKVVLMLRKEPEQDNPNSVFEGKNSSRHAFFTTKIANALSHGAAAVIFVNDHYGVQEATNLARKQWQEAVDELVKARNEFQAAGNPTDEQTAEHRQKVRKLADAIVELDEKLQGDHDELLDLEGAGLDTSPPKLPVFFARRSQVDPVVKAALGKDLAELETTIDVGPTPRSQSLTGWSVACASDIVFQKATVKNVAGVLEGDGPLADETIIVGAHYDHLGQGGAGSLAPWTKEVHNGADDNASGTAALLEVARQLTTRDAKPARRIVFLAFAGEERGLLGSRHYVEHPAIPLERTVAMVNMDMVGRLQNNSLVVHGTGTADLFDGLIDELNKEYAFDIKKEPGGSGPSDHQTFYSEKIPVFHFFTGTHGDYHRPSDDADKLNISGMARVSEMVADVVERLAALESRPNYVEVRRQRRNRGGQRPYLGSVPDINRQVEGYALLDVAKDGPAEKAGMKPGDVVVKFGDAKITGFDDLDAALRRHQPGDQVTVVLTRDGQEVSVEVTLAPPQ